MLYRIQALHVVFHYLECALHPSLRIMKSVRNSLGSSLMIPSQKPLDRRREMLRRELAENPLILRIFHGFRESGGKNLPLDRGNKTILNASI